jgi:hypothetical protein
MLSVILRMEDVSDEGGHQLRIQIRHLMMRRVLLPALIWGVLRIAPRKVLDSPF